MKQSRNQPLVRGKAEYLGGTRFRFTCPKGHSHVKDMGKGPVTKRLSEDSCRQMSSYWAANGMSFPCRACHREHKERLKLARFEVFLRRDPRKKVEVAFDGSHARPSLDEIFAMALPALREKFRIPALAEADLDYRRTYA